MGDSSFLLTVAALSKTWTLWIFMKTARTTPSIAQGSSKATTHVTQTALQPSCSVQHWHSSEHLTWVVMPHAWCLPTRANTGPGVRCSQLFRPVWATYSLLFKCGTPPQPQAALR